MKHNYAAFAHVCLDCGLRLEEIVERGQVTCSRKMVKRRRYLRQYDRRRQALGQPIAARQPRLTDAERFLRWRFRQPFDLYRLALAVGWEPKSKPERKPAPPWYSVLK